VASPASLVNHQPKESSSKGSVDGLKEKNVQNEFTKIREAIESRVRIKISLKEWLQSFLVKLKCVLRQSRQKIMRKAILFDNAKDAMTEELDIVQLIKNMRRLQVLEELLLKKYQKQLIKYYKANVVTD